MDGTASTLALRRWTRPKESSGRRCPGEIGREVTAEQIRGLDGVMLWGMQLTEQTLEGADRLAVVARLGVGYDNVDVDACTERGIAVTITPDGVRRPMAATTLLLVLATGHKLLIKDQIARQRVLGRPVGPCGPGDDGAAPSD